MQVADDITTQRRDYVCSWVAICFSVLAFALLALVITKVYHPDVQHCLDYAQNETNVTPSDFKPEPVEKLLYALGVFTAPFFLFFFYRMAAHFLNRYTKGAYISVFVIASALLGILGFLCFRVTTPYAGQVFKTYCSPLFFYEFPVTAVIIYLVLLFLFFYALPRVPEVAKQYAPFLSGSVLVILCALLFVRSIFFTASIIPIPEYFLHFNAVFSSQAQVSGGIPLLVDGFRNTYGLYPHFLAPIFSITGLNVFTFSAVMGALIVATFVCLFFTLRLATQSRMVFLLGFIASVYFDRLYLYLAAYRDRCFQFFPIRTIFPALIFLLIALYLLKNKRWLYYPIFALCTLGALWNLETGIIIFFSWLCLLCYLEIVGKNRETAWRPILSHLGWAACLSLATCCLYSLSIFIGYGRWPNLWIYPKALSIFSSMGYYMLPMPLLHPWNLLIPIYLWGLLYGVRAFLKKESSPRTSFVVFLAIAGIGFFGYYQGRSHDINLMSCLREPLLLLALFMDDAWVAFRQARGANKFLPHRALFLSVILFIFIQGALSIGSNWPTFEKEMVMDLSVLPEQPMGDVMRNLAFIKPRVQPGERVLIIADEQGVYHAETKTASTFPIAQIDMFFKSEADALTQMIQTHPQKIFWEPKSHLSPFSRVNMNQVLNQCLQERRYIVRESNGTMVLLEPAGIPKNDQPQ